MRSPWHSGLWVSVFLSVVVASQTRDALAQRLQQKLVGSWVVDLEGSKELGKRPAEAVAQLQVLDLHFAIEFTTDGKFSVQLSLGGKQQQKKGTWKVLTESGDRLILEITKEGESSASRNIAEFLPDGRLKISPEKKPTATDPTLVFQRGS